MKERWIPTAQVLYIGKAGGKGGAETLRSRLGKYLKHGSGQPVAHWGGRLIWQLKDAEALWVAWSPELKHDPEAVETALLRRFRVRFKRLPFANLRDGPSKLRARSSKAPRMSKPQVPTATARGSAAPLRAQPAVARSRATGGIAGLLHTVAFAAHKHRSQRRKDKDASAYINHPIALAELLASAGIEHQAVLQAALLHDTVEDTDTRLQELEEQFGKDVAGIVREVTDDKLLSKEERKRLQIEHAAALSREAKLVKLADKICNLRDINSAPPAGWTLERKQEYFDWAKRVVDQVRGVNRKLEELFDVEYARRP